MKKFWLVLGAIIVILVIYWAVSQSKQVEYVELNKERPVRGNPEASVVIVEYSDFQCPACGASQPIVEDILLTYEDKVKLEYHHFPLTSHRYAYKAAEAAECAGDQKKFWEYHDLLFDNQNSLLTADLENYAGQTGINVELWQDCLTTHVKKYIIEKDLAEAKNLGLDSTPTFFLNGQKVSDWRKLPEMVQALVEPLVPLQNGNATSTVNKE